MHQPPGKTADSITYMVTKAALVKRMQADTRKAAALHEQSRALLVAAARSGAAAGLSQREIAAAIGRSQPEVSRLLRFTGTTDRGRTLTQYRHVVIDVAKAHGATNIRIFGGVANGTDVPDSDLDLLVDLAPTTTHSAVAKLERDLGDLLGTAVRVRPAVAPLPTDAVPL